MNITKEVFLQLESIHLNVENRKKLQPILDILSPDYIKIIIIKGEKYV